MDGVAAGGVTGGGATGAVVQAASTPRIAAQTTTPGRTPRAVTGPPTCRRPPCTMWLIFVEALAALLILIFIVWWTMFSGRKRGERDDTPDRDDTPRR
jgi:nitrate/nitrite transporter NarK